MSADKQYSCSECGASYYRIYELQRHQRTKGHGNPPASRPQPGRPAQRKHQLNDALYEEYCSKMDDNVKKPPGDENSTNEMDSSWETVDVKESTSLL